MHAHDCRFNNYAISEPTVGSVTTIIYNKCMPKMSIFNLEYYYGLFLNLVSDAALGLFLKAGSKTYKIYIRMLGHMVLYVAS